MSMEDNRVAVSIFSVLAERDRRFSVVEGDNSIKGLPFSTYTLRGEGRLKKLLNCAYDKTDRLREMQTRGRGGS